MELRALRSGGFAAPLMRKELGPVDTDTLPDRAQAVKIEREVDDGAFFGLRDRYANEDARDTTGVSLSVSDGGREKAVFWDGLADDTPETLRRLLRLLEKSGHPW